MTLAAEQRNIRHIKGVTVAHNSLFSQAKPGRF